MNPAADYLDKLAEKYRALTGSEPAAAADVYWHRNRAAALALKIAAADLRAGLHLLEDGE